MEANFFKFELFLFADYDEVVASPENINFFVEKFLPHNFIPRQIQELSLNIKRNKSDEFNQDIIINRLGLNSFDKKWEILFHKDHLKIVYNFDFFKNDIFSLDDYRLNILKYLNIISEKFSKKFNRMGIVTNKLIPIDDNQKSKEYFLKYNKDSNFVGEGLFPVEWTSKILVRKKISDLNDEILNISNLNSFFEGRLSSNDRESDFKGIRNIIDINTLPLITEKRFDNSSVEKFLNNSIDLFNQVLEYNNL
ncbi:hypothetical protein [Chishuiella changwenlii]|uniref:hypothetical protein n=1 Tax=Chishuiella changwenlii TaxID=1434701 RepID=UPI002FD8B00B